MNNELMNTHENTWNLAGRFTRNAAVAGTLAFAFALPNAIADDDYEWDSTWGLHEEEWYDPSDWFNGDDEIDYEDDGYDDSYFSDSSWSSYDYYGDYGYNYTNYDPSTIGYDYYYQWSPEDQNWAEVKGNKSTSVKLSSEAKATSKKMSKNKETKNINKKDVITMRGNIQNIGNTQTKGAKKNHTFAMLEASSGKSVLVDFGPNAKLDKINLKNGNKIQVRGPRVKLGGKYVLVAQQVSAINPEMKN